MQSHRKHTWRELGESRRRKALREGDGGRESGVRYAKERRGAAGDPVQGTGRVQAKLQRRYSRSHADKRLPMIAFGAAGPSSSSSSSAWFHSPPPPATCARSRLPRDSATADDGYRIYSFYLFFASSDKFITTASDEDGYRT